MLKKTNLFTGIEVVFRARGREGEEVTAEGAEAGIITRDRHPRSSLNHHGQLQGEGPGEEEASEVGGEDFLEENHKMIISEGNPMPNNLGKARSPRNQTFGMNQTL